MQKIDNPTAEKLMLVLHQFRRLHMRQQSGGNHTPGEMMLIACIKRSTEEAGTGVRVSDLSSLLNVASPTVTQQVNNLVSQGFAERVTDPEDRRAVRITLTEVGVDVLEKASARYLSMVQGLTEYLGEKDSEKLAELMGRVLTYFNEVRETNPSRDL